MVALGQQGVWARRDGILKRKVCWSDICGSNFAQIQFLIQDVYDTLLCLAKLHTWGKAETPLYPLCEKRGSLKHILSSYPRAIDGGRYRWRQNQVLRVIAGVFNKCLRTNTYKPVCRKINSVKAGGNVRLAPSEKKYCFLAQLQIGSYLLIWMSSWNSLIVLFEHNFSRLVSNVGKQVIMWELTVSKRWQSPVILW